MTNTGPIAYERVMGFEEELRRANTIVVIKKVIFDENWVNKILLKLLSRAHLRFPIDLPVADIFTDIPFPPPLSLNFLRSKKSANCGGGGRAAGYAIVTIIESEKILVLLFKEIIYRMLQKWFEVGL